MKSVGTKYEEENTGWSTVVVKQGYTSFFTSQSHFVKAKEVKICQI